MKNIVLVCSLFIAVCLVGAVPAGASTPTVMISNYNVTPAVLLPGDTGTLSFTVMTTDQSATEQVSSGGSGAGFENTQTTTINVFIRNIHVEGNGITVLTKDFDRVGDLAPGQSIPITVLIQAPAQSGMYFPEIWVDTGTGIGDGTSTRYPVPVNVNTQISVLKKPDLSLQKIIPDSVVPGDSFPCTITVQNAGEARADDIFITINTTSSSLSLTSPANYYLDHLDPGENMTFNLQFNSDKEAPLGISPIPVTINYADADGIRKNLVENLGIPLRGRAKMAIKSLVTDPIQPNLNDPITLTLRIENTGTDRTDSVIATLDTPLSGTKEAFVGSIDIDSDAPAIFYLSATQSGQIPLIINISYDDDYGPHTLTENTIISVKGSNEYPVIIVVLIIAACGAGVWYWRTKRK